jgi:hypothetical protein
MRGLGVTAVEWRIEALCGQLADGELSQMLADAGAGDVLERVLDAVRAGKPAEITVADLNDLEDAAARIGIDGLTTGVRAPGGGNLATRLPGFGGGGPHFAWVCPQHVCARVELDTPDPVPACAISGQPLERRTQPG